MAPACQVAFAKGRLQTVRRSLEATAGCPLTDDMLAAGIRAANEVRRLLAEIRLRAFTSPICPMPALQVLTAETFAIHYCSGRSETLQDLLTESRHRVALGQGPLPADQGHAGTGRARVFWVNPVADLRAMNLLEECGGRLCGSDFMFCHALDEIPQDVEPMEALARTALADPMVGSSADRAERICRDIARASAEAVVISRIPGASHCGCEAPLLAEIIGVRLRMPVVQVEVPPLTDALEPSLRTRLAALVETAQLRREGP